MFIKFCQQLKKTVDRTGLEPVTSALSKQRSKPTELTTHAISDLRFRIAAAFPQSEIANPKSSASFKGGRKNRNFYGWGNVQRVFDKKK